MKKKHSFFVRVLFLLILQSLFSKHLFAQVLQPIDEPQEPCGTTLLLSRNLAEDPGMPERLSKMKEQEKKHGSNSVNSSPPGNYVIPVVFHIITDPTNPTPAPSYARIQMQLASLNAAFSNSLNSLNNVAAGPHAVNAQIQFCFAKQRMINGSPAAWPTTSVGVIYHSTTNSITTNVNVMSNPSMASLSALTNAQFPPGMYLNIWCVPNISTTGNTSVNAPPSILGMATFPWMTMPIDGILMRNDCIGNNTYKNFNGLMFSQYDKGNVLAHEAGHYLGLFHVFETIVNSNVATAGGLPGCYGVTSPTTDGDLIFDTPPTMINGPMAALGSYNTCQETYSPYGSAQPPNVSDQLENFMSYSDDDYLNTFTQDQAERMWAAPACGPGLLNANFTTRTTSLTCTTAAVQFQQPLLPGYLSVTTHTWYFGDGGTSNVQNPLHVYSIAPYFFTATLAVSNGTSTLSYTLGVNIPSGLPEIGSWSGQNGPVCRGSEQTILIKFPANVLTALITDGTTSYAVNSNVVHTQTWYEYPFTFTITNSGTWSLSLGSCVTPTTVASFTVLDCCPNLVVNGDLEAGPVGFTSGYNLTTNNFSNGNAAIAPAFGMFISETNQTGKQMMIDAFGTPSGCSNPSIQTLLFGQAITGLQPSTDYYIAVKTNQSADSSYIICANKYRMRLYCSSAPNLFSKTLRPSNVPHPNKVVPNSGADGWGSKQVFAFKVTTPANITPATTFSFEVHEVDNRYGFGFDYTLDNFIVARLGGAISLSPPSASITGCSGTVQLTASGTCSNLASYNLLWLPTNGVSCSTCAVTVASPSATTVYTLLAIPPITTPPTPNIVLTSTVFVSGGIGQLGISTTTLVPCPPTYSLTLSTPGVISATWQPGNASGTVIVVSPTVPVTYTVGANVMSNQQNCLAYTTISVNVPAIPTVTALAQRPSICKNEQVTLTASGAATYTWSTTQTGSLITVSPQQPTTFTVQGENSNGCKHTASVTVKVSSCVGIDEQEALSLFKVYPNPNSGQFSVKAGAAVELSLYNNLGQVIRRVKLDASNDHQATISGLAPGVYFLSGATGKGRLREKIVVEGN